MPIKLDTARPLDRQRILKSLRTDFPEAKVRKGITGNINVYRDIDSLVVIKIRRSKVRIMGTCPLLYGLLNPPGQYGIGEDKKRAEEKTFAKWLRENSPESFA